MTLTAASTAAVGVRAVVRDGHVPCTITARLRTGVVMTPPYGLDLAGILAASLRRVLDAQRVQDRPYTDRPLPDTTGEDPVDLDLPVSTCHTLQGTWCWLASCAILPDPVPAVEPRFHYRVTDTGWAGRAAHRPLPQVLQSAGPYRDVMMPAPVLPVTGLSWRAVADPDRVRDLLRPLWSIGGRRATGEGRVLDWTVQPCTDAGVDPIRWAFVGEDGAILRPIPAAVADHLGIRYELGWYALRPPSWHRDRLEQLAMTPPDEDWDFADGWD